MLILRLWRQQPGRYFCISTKSASKQWKDNFFSRDEFRNVADFIEDNSDKDIYFCPHGFTKPKRREEFAVMPSLMWADLDEANPSKISIKPTVAIESSPGRFVGLWVIDKPLPGKELNQRLTYHIGADKGGWDLTQVLRVPGTTNYKYTSTPKVRTTWTDGPTYTLREITKLLPADRAEERDGDAQETYEKYEKDLPPWVRRELLNGRPKVGKRSEMLWKLVNSLIEAGVTKNDCFILLRASPWNKFEGRDDQLEREIAKATGTKFKGKKKREAVEEDYKFLSLSMEDVEEENIDWIWYPYLARGELSILEGDPSVGKSYLAEMVCGSFVDGRRLPSIKKGQRRTQGPIAYFDLENSAGSVTKKRLRWNNFENLKDYYQEEEAFSIDDERAMEGVLEAIEKIKPVCVVFDTLNTYIGKADTYNTSEAQQAFKTFRNIAKRFNCSVLVLRHLRKGSKERALYAGTGSISFIGLARTVMTVGVMPDDPDTRVMAATKNNLTKLPRALTFTIDTLPDTLKEQDRSRFKWGEFVDVTSDEVVAATSKGKDDKDGNERGDAEQFLREQLNGAALETSKLERIAETKGFHWKAVQRAATSLGIVREYKGFGASKTSLWRLPK